MKLLTLASLLLIVSACTSSSHYKVIFSSNAIKLEPDEAIEQVTLRISQSTFVRANDLPVDWSAGAHNSLNETSILLNCDHLYFSVSDLSLLSGRLIIDSKSSAEPVEVKIYTTKGPIGHGRIIELQRGDIIISH